MRKVESVDGLREELLGNFPDVLSNFLSKDLRVKGDPMSICFKEGVSFLPFRVTRCRQVPLHMKDEADALLADLEQKGVLCWLECDETTENPFRKHFVPKPGGKGVRLVTDYTPINPYIERPVHPFPSPDIIFQSVGKDSKWFAKLDALHGYYQIPLVPESQKLTAFLLSQGRFSYLVALMGLNPSGDWWCRKSDKAIAGLFGVRRLVDGHFSERSLARGVAGENARCPAAQAHPWHHTQQDEARDRPQRPFCGPQRHGRGR